MCFLLLFENRHLRKKWEWFSNERVRQEAVIDDGFKLWQYEAVFSPFSYFWSIIDWGLQMILFQNLLCFALRPHFPWAALCFWQSPLSQELPDGVFELFFVNLKHVCPAFSHSLPQGLTCLTVWCSSSLFWLLSYCLLRGHFPHTVPAHSFLASSSWKTQTDTKVYA